MKIHNVAQGSMEWLRLRAGVITASEFHHIVKADFTPRESKGVESYMHTKLAEKWMGGPLQSFSGGNMEQGILREPKAVSEAAFDLNMAAIEVGFIATDDGRVGCSPDGMLLKHGQSKIFSGSDFGGLEGKCPDADTHVGYLLDNILPPKYAPQVHGSMYVTGAPWWYFLSWHPVLPKLLLKIERDEKIQKALHESLTGFLERFDIAWARLLLRGEPPVREDIAANIRRGFCDADISREPDIWRNSQ